MHEKKEQSAAKPKRDGNDVCLAADLSVLRTSDAANFTGLVREAVSKTNFARKYALESSRRDLHNALESLLHSSSISIFVVEKLPKELLNKC